MRSWSGNATWGRRGRFSQSYSAQRKRTAKLSFLMAAIRARVCLHSALATVLIFTPLWFAHADGNSASRILNFESKVVITKNRDLAVMERIEISNANGYFDSGLHRYLSVKRVNAQRRKPGSFESIHATVDGRDAQVNSEQSDIFHIGIPAEGGSWSRGTHIIELSYTARNQLTDYGDYQDLNQDITGEWQVPMEMVTVELDFPEGVPHQLSISADTGTEADFKFDCERTELPFGIKFETTHPLLPGQRLFISARLMQAGYFAPDSADGIRGLFAKHPLLSPTVWGLGSLFVLIGFAYVLAKGNPSSNVASNWIRVLLLVSLPGTALLALRLVYEQTVMTWRNGEQMVGFALAHASVLFFLPMLLSLVVAHVALACVISVTFARWLRKLPTPRFNWLVVGTLAVSIMLVYILYNIWMTATIRIAGPGVHGSSFLMMAAADDKLPLAKILIAKGVSPNTMAGGSTALDVACSSRNLDVARFLLQQGADLSRAPSCATLNIKSESSGSH